MLTLLTAAFIKEDIPMKKEQLISEIRAKMNGKLSEKQMNELTEVLISSLTHVKVESITDQDVSHENKEYLNMYLAAKKIEGCSDKTLKYYATTVKKLFECITKNVKEITTADIRKFLVFHQSVNNANKVTMDNIRRILSGFFAWLEDEDYIIKSPARRIKKVKTAQIIKETFSDESLEVLRSSCETKRDLALVEFLSSTGVRVGELVTLNRTSINFIERSCIVLGKGNKEREVYFDAKTKLHLQEYLKSRKDSNEALFVSLKAPYQRLSINGIEKILKQLGKNAKLKNVYPHKFRRTLATMAIDKGMPIEQVQHLLGHVRIDTTMHYAMVNQNNVKQAHRKYIG